jgi:serine/threonine protein kinase
LLKKNSLDVNRLAHHRQSILHIMAKKFAPVDEKMWTILKKRLTSFNPVSVTGDTPLHVCAQTGHMVLLEYLLTVSGLNVNLQNRRGETPLWIAVEKDRLNIVTALLAAGASVDLADLEGRRPLEVAISVEVESALHEVLRAQKASSSYGLLRDTPLTRSAPMLKQHSTGNIGSSFGSSQFRASASQPLHGSPPHSPSHSRVHHYQSHAMAIPTALKFGGNSNDSIASSSSSMLSSSAPNGWSVSRDRSGSMSSFTQASHRLILMDEELHHSSSSPRAVEDSPNLVTENMQAVDRLGNELVEELGHLLSDGMILDALQKITSSKSFRWRSSYMRTKVEVLKWMADFVGNEDEQQGYLRHLKTKYPEAIKLTFVRTTSAKKLSKKEKSQKKLTLLERKIKAYEWELEPESLLLGDMIGTGSFGSVYHATMVQTGEDVAVKQLAEDVNSEDSATFMKEIAILSRLHHPSIVGFVGASITGALALVMEYCAQGNLKMFLQANKPGWNHKCRLARQAAEGIGYLHMQSPPIVHRDLKCQNILVTAEGSAKVSDFGLSKTIFRTIGNASKMGTLNWLAPEVLRGEVHHSIAVDVYAFGMVLYEILMDGTPPYESWAPLQIVRAIDEGRKPEVPSTCDPNYKALMEECWHPEPELRPSFHEICLKLRTIERLSRSSGSSSSDSNSNSPPVTPRSGSASFLPIKKKSGAESPSKASTSPSHSPLSETRASSLKLRPKPRLAATPPPNDNQS